MPKQPREEAEEMPLKPIFETPRIEFDVSAAARELKHLVGRRLTEAAVEGELKRGRIPELAKLGTRGVGLESATPSVSIVQRVRDQVEKLDEHLRAVMIILYGWDPATEYLNSSLRRKKAAGLLHHPGMSARSFRDGHELKLHVQVARQLPVRRDWRDLEEWYVTPLPQFLRAQVNWFDLFCGYERAMNAIFHLMQMLRYDFADPGPVFTRETALDRVMRCLAVYGKFRRHGFVYQHWLLPIEEYESYWYQLRIALEDTLPIAMADLNWLSRRADLHSVLRSGQFLERLLNSRRGRCVVRWVRLWLERMNGDHVIWSIYPSLEEVYRRSFICPSSPELWSDDAWDAARIFYSKSFEVKPLPPLDERMPRADTQAQYLMEIE